MPRSNRPRGRRTGPEDDGGDLSHLMSGWKRTETRRGAEWNVQPVSAARAVKDYICPACSLTVPQGTAHLVVWRADGVLGDAADLAARRHWHTHCWRLG
ncbi:hypothetical protein IWX78_001316 [Mycetocola sp. CAN_C7]|uniref:hypothetical protein n=1 Tax=Mycetocola sp. CAN_C7 TaxID=2787724 RepID=UPI0018C92091